MENIPNLADYSSYVFAAYLITGVIISVFLFLTLQKYRGLKKFHAKKTHSKKQS